MTWSLPAGRYFGIRVRIALLFLLFVFCKLWEAAAQGGMDGLRFTATWSAILFVSVLLHEFGHCFAGRAVGGEAEEILMWPLGGLAFVSAPNTPRDQFITTVCGPLVNVAICLVSGGLLLSQGIQLNLNPLADGFLAVKFFAATELVPGTWFTFLQWTAIVFGLNWVMILFNLIPAFPLDGGRMFRCLLWRGMGFVRATRIAVQVAKICAIALFGLGVLYKDLILIGIAFFVWLSSEKERQMLEAGLLFDDSLFGYDFSQGYTSLAKSAAKSKARRPSVWERWWRRRERIKRERQQAALEQQERRVDEILAKLHREGMASLTEQERRFLTRVSEKYRSRNRAGQ